MAQRRKRKYSKKQGKRRNKKKHLLIRNRELFLPLLVGVSSVVTPTIVASALRWMSKLKKLMEAKKRQLEIQNYQNKQPSLSEQYKKVRLKTINYMNTVARSAIEASAKLYPEAKYLDLDIPEYQHFKAFEETGDVKHLRPAVEHILNRDVLPMAQDYFKYLFYKKDLPKSLYNTYKKENLDTLVEYTKDLLSRYRRTKT